MAESKLTEKKNRFCYEFLVDLNAEAAAIRAGYSPKYARGNAHKLVADSCIKERIRQLMAEKEKELIADGEEVLKYLTKVMRGQSESSVLARDETGAERVIMKPPDEKERTKAAELLGKAHMLFTDKVQQDVDMDFNITVKRV